MSSLDSKTLYGNEIQYRGQAVIVIDGDYDYLVNEYGLDEFFEETNTDPEKVQIYEAELVKPPKFDLITFIEDADINTDSIHGNYEDEINKLIEKAVGEQYVQGERRVLYIKNPKRFQYKAIPASIQAFRWDGNMFNEKGAYVPDWALRALEEEVFEYGSTDEHPHCPLILKFSYGSVHAEVGDWVVRNSLGVISVLNDSEFHRIYRKEGEEFYD